MISEKLEHNGTLDVLLTDANGTVKQHFTAKNLIVAVGLAFIASRIGTAPATAMSHMAIGTGTIVPALADTTLETENARAALASTGIVTTTVAGDSVQFVATFAPEQGTGAVTEAGIFNDAVAGTMLCRTVFPVINKADTDTLTITWKVRSA